MKNTVLAHHHSSVSLNHAGVSFINQVNQTNWNEQMNSDVHATLPLETPPHPQSHAQVSADAKVLVEDCLLYLCTMAYF